MNLPQFVEFETSPLEKMVLKMSQIFNYLDFHLVLYSWHEYNKPFLQS